MKVNTSFKIGNLSKQGYRHFPLLYFAYGKNGFSICIIGLTFTVKLFSLKDAN